MANVNIRKRGKVYQYQFEAASVDGKRKQITKSGFKTKLELLKQNKGQGKLIWVLLYIVL